MGARPLDDAKLADLQRHMAAQAAMANDPDSRDQAQALAAALDELAERRRRHRSEIDRYGISGRVRRAIAAAGSQAAFRRAHPPMSQGYLSDYLRGEDEPGPLILDAVGVRRRIITIYEVVGKEGTPPAPTATTTPDHEGEAPCTDR